MERLDRLRELHGVEPHGAGAKHRRSVDRHRQWRLVEENHRRRDAAKFCELKDTINTTVDQLNAFASEVTRVAREVGTEGKLGGQADVRGVAGTWKDLTDSVNSMASNLTAPGTQHRRSGNRGGAGDLSKKITVNV